MLLSADTELHTAGQVVWSCYIRVPDAPMCSTLSTHKSCLFERTDSFCVVFFQSIFEGSSSLPDV